MIYEVTIVRTGFAFVDVESAAAAIDLANHLTTDEISWSDDWNPTEAVEVDGYEGPAYTDPSF